MEDAQITETLVRHIAHLARLELSDAEVAAMQPQLARIFDHIASVAQIDAEDADPATQAPINFDALRADDPGPTLGRRAITQNAPAHDGSFLVVPRFFDDPDTQD